MGIGYFIKEGVAGLKRARLAAFTSVFSLFLAVLLVGVLARIGFNAYEVSQMLRADVEVELFLQPLDDQSTRELRSRIQAEPLVAEISYISRDSASAIFRRDFGMGSETIADLNFLPASFRLTMAGQSTSTQIDSLAGIFESYRGVDDVKFNAPLLRILEQRTDQLAMAGGALGLFILLIAMILVFNTIRLTIYAKRDLIRAMKLVGATNRFIRSPFLFEGLLQGFIAGMAACGVIYLVFELIVPETIPQLGVLGWPYGRWYFLMGGVLGIALLMGWWGSRWAARKFIRDTKVYQ
ncbi:MAG: cell division protein FtsX [Balneolaceae bacterium]